MSWVRATAVRWVSDEPFPGWVEVHLALADGSVAVFNDKPPIFEDGDRLRPDTDYPIGIALACRIESGFDAGRDAVLVTLENGASDAAGAVAFSVPRDNVTFSDCTRAGLRENHVRQKRPCSLVKSCSTGPPPSARRFRLRR